MLKPPDPKLTVLSVAYPFAPVGPDAVGGAEQVLSHLDAALVAAGHRSVVVACEGSEPAGTLVPSPAVDGAITEDARRRLHEGYRQLVAGAIEQYRPDVVHLHGIDFFEYLPQPGVPALVTLHLPPDWYPPSALRPGRPQTYLHCVSSSQRRACPPDLPLLPEIDNGVPVDALDGSGEFRRRDFALALGRICPEKNFHVALDAAELAGVPMLLAGEVFAYDAHQAYFRTQIEPRLDRRRRFIGPVGIGRKRRLLSSARCLLIPSLAAETSSLVAREALACGTPVIAFPSGALPEVVEPGVNGFLVRDAREMGMAIRNVHRIDRSACRAAARHRFCLQRMVDRYFEVYRRIA